MDVHLIILLEVVYHRDVFTLVVEGLTRWIFVPDDLVDVVSALVAPVGND